METRCQICGGRDDAHHDQLPHAFEPAPDPAAVLYVQIAAHLDALDQRVTELQRQVGRLVAALELHNSIQARTAEELLRMLSANRPRSTVQ